MSRPFRCEKRYAGTFGDPIREELPEVMVQAAFDHHGLAFRYVTTRVWAGGLAAVPAENHSRSDRQPVRPALGP